MGKSRLRRPSPSFQVGRDREFASFTGTLSHVGAIVLNCGNSRFERENYSNGPVASNCALGDGGSAARSYIGDCSDGLGLPLQGNCAVAIAVVDVLGVLIYFTLARLILQI